VFASVIILIGWVGQGCGPTVPQPPPGRRLKAVDAPDPGVGRTTDRSTDLRRAA
jgi:hypothetical protein